MVVVAAPSNSMHSNGSNNSTKNGVSSLYKEDKKKRRKLKLRSCWPWCLCRSSSSASPLLQMATLTLILLYLFSLLWLFYEGSSVYMAIEEFRFRKRGSHVSSKKNIRDLLSRAYRVPVYTAVANTDSNSSSADESSAPPPYASTTVAVCHKTLFGTIDLYTVLEWIAYYRLLGVDTIFMSYLPDVAQSPGFADLQRLPFVKLQVNTHAGIGTLPVQEGSSKEGTAVLAGEHDQRYMEAQCLLDAEEYDWVLLADADEFLWYNKQVGIKEFLYDYKDYDYLSFGKWMYTMKHSVKKERQNATPFSLETFPFTAGAFCAEWSKAGQGCVGHRGRCKVMVQPKIHGGGVSIHGTHDPYHREKSYHFDKDVAHLKEWKSYNSISPDKPNRREPADFTIKNADDVNIHTFKSYAENEDQTRNMYYDDQWKPWLEFLWGRGVRPGGTRAF